MKPALSLQLGQHLALTPQLRQAIRLLALSTLELKGELTEAVETNPLLEFDEGISENPVPEAEEPRSEGPEASETERDAGSNDAEAEFQASDDDSWALSASGSGSGSGSGEGDSAEARMSAEEDLSAHLLWQLHLTPLSDRDQAIGVALIESLDQDGYWRSGMESLIAALSPELSVDPEEVEAVRHRIQRFDPIGVASCDLADCLDVQLSEAVAVVR